MDPWLRQRLVVLGIAHVVMLAVMQVLLETYEPDPNGFRLSNGTVLVSFALLTILPVVVGLASASRVGLALVALIQAGSPLLLRSTMSDPSQDINFVYLLWWIPVPFLAGVVVAGDNILKR